MKKSIRLLSGLLSAVLLTACFSACGENGTETVTKSTREKDNEQSEGYTYVSPNVHYGGDAFRIYTWSTTDEWVLDADQTATPIDAKTYEHFCEVEDELGVILEIAQKVSGGYGAHTEFVNKVAMLTGEDDIDLVAQYSLASIYGAMQGVYRNLVHSKYINWDAPYWSNGFVSQNTINNKLFYCTGSVTRTVLYNMYMMVFNYDKSVDFGLGDVYALVEDGDWTIAKLKELSQDIYEDLNHNSAADSGDLFGLVCSDYLSLDPFQYGVDLNCMAFDDMGDLQVDSEFSGTYGETVTSLVRDLFHNNEGAYLNDKVKPKYFAMIDGNAVFETVNAGYLISTLSPSDINYGILPIPKASTEQKQYQTCLGMTYSTFSIPVTASNPDESSAVLEALAHDGYVNLDSYIFETNLKAKMSRRPQDATMFEYLRSGIVYDLGRLMDNADMFALFRRAVRDDVTLGSYYREHTSQIRSGLNDVNFAFSD